MAYSLSSSTIPTIRSYADALAFYDKAKPFRNPQWGHADERKIVAGSSKQNWGVRKHQRNLGLDAIVFRYHRTDVVTWYSDNTFKIERWSSMSTSVFANALTPNIVSFQMTSGCGAVVHCYPEKMNADGYRDWDNKRIYDMKSSGMSFAFDAELGYWLPTSGIDPFNHPRPKRKEAKAALEKHGFYRFQHYVAAALCIAKPQKAPWVSDDPLEKLAKNLNTYRGERAIVDALDNPSQWMALLMAPAFWPEESHYRKVYGRRLEYTVSGHTRRILDAVRTAVYRVEDVIEDHYRDFVGSESQAKAASRARSLYRRY